MPEGREAKIVRDPLILVGKPTIEGTRISVELILDCFASGMTADDIIAEWDHLTKDDIRAALLYASRAVSRHMPWKAVKAANDAYRRAKTPGAAE